MLSTLAARTIGCSYTLASAPPDPTLLFVFFGTTLVSQGAANGWVYNAAANQVDFFGASCAQLKSNTVSNVQIVYGCPTASFQ